MVTTDASPRAAAPTGAWVSARLAATLLDTYHARVLELARSGVIRSMRPPSGRGFTRYCLGDILRLAAEATATDTPQAED
jgi:hypothetical protein